MDVRHNTTLLERAIELVVQRASIPVRRAEAEAAEKLALAAARRRLATGAAVALAALGIGLGAYFGLWKRNVVSERVATTSTERPIDKENEQPALPSQPDEKPPVPLPSRSPATPNSREPVINYDKFVTQQVDFMGRRWEVVAGHHFNSDTDSVWSNAWCYTEQDIDGVRINIKLAARESQTALPLGPIASVESLSKVGLNDASAMELASNCHWLDGKTYSKNEYAAYPDRAPVGPYASPARPTSPPAPTAPISPPSSPQIQPVSSYVSRDGFDMPNNDLDNASTSSNSLSECESSCNNRSGCVAYVFNKMYKKCFLKARIGTLLANDTAYTGYNSSISETPRTSLLQIHDKTAQIGKLYRSTNAPKYLDCIVECDNDFSCVGFNYDPNSRQCDLLQQIVKSQSMPGLYSGVKASME